MGVGGWGRKERAEVEGASVRFMRDCSRDILPYAEAAERTTTRDAR